MPTDLPDNPYGSPQTDSELRAQPIAWRLTAGHVAWCIAVINLVAILVLGILTILNHFMPLNLRPIPQAILQINALWCIFGVPSTSVGMVTQYSRLKARVSWGFWCVVLFTAFVWLAMLYYYMFLWNPYRWENHG